MKKFKKKFKKKIFFLTVVLVPSNIFDCCASAPSTTVKILTIIIIIFSGVFDYCARGTSTIVKILAFNFFLRDF